MTILEASSALDGVLDGAAADGLIRGVSVQAGNLHRLIGGYPARDGAHSMPTVCGAMRREYSPDKGDRIVYEPKKGKGASLEIEFVLPR